MKLVLPGGAVRGAVVLLALSSVHCDLIRRLTGPTPLAIQSFTATPSAGLAPGAPVVLSWAVDGADSVQIDNGVGDVGAKGTRTLQVQWSTAFTLSARSSGSSAHATVQVFVIPPFRLPVLVPAPGPAPAPGATPAPVPPPVNTPAPTPTPDPGAPPPPSGAVARVHIGVLFLVCGDQGVPNSIDATNVAVGCKVHIDMNLKDSRNKPTSPRGPQRWNFGSPDLVRVVDNDPWSPIILALAPGNVTISAEVDGVRSNDLNLRFY